MHPIDNVMGTPPTTATLAHSDHKLLKKLDHRQAVVRDRVRGVVLGHHAGFYLYGRPGTSKTYTIRTTLQMLEARYHYHDGHLTPMGLFELLEKHHDSVIVLDDVSAIFQQPVALQILLAALGRQVDDGKARTIKYKRQDQEKVIHFTGGIICISNIPLQALPLLSALKSRVHYLQFDPTDEQIAALMRAVAAKGWPDKVPVLSPTECREIADFLIAETQRLNLPLDMRLLVDKAFPDFHQHRSGQTESHWKDLVMTTLTECLVDPKYTLLPRSRADVKAREQQITREIVARGNDIEERLKLWTQRTGKSSRAFYRRQAEIDGSDTLTLSPIVTTPHRERGQ